MSGTLSVKFAKGEIIKAKEIIRKLSPDGTNVFPPDLKEIPKESKTRGVYVECKKNIMSFDYAIWDSYGSGYVTILAQEMAKYLKVERAGWDSIGWCKDMNEFMECHGFYGTDGSRIMSFIFDKFFGTSKYGTTAKKLEEKVRAIVEQQVAEAVNGIK